MKQISAGLVGRLLTGQTLLGAKDGVNKVFTTAKPFLRTGDFREAVYVSGLRYSEGIGQDYIAVESGGAGTGYDTIVFSNPPQANDDLLIDYYPSGF